VLSWSRQEQCAPQQMSYVVSDIVGNVGHLAVAAAGAGDPRNPNPI
jgi:hypothetical protein